MFDSTVYEVRQKFGIGNKYTVYEGEGSEAILTSKQKKLRLKEDFRFNDADTDEERIRVRASQMLDVNAAYDIVDSRTDEPIGAVKRRVSSFLKHEYELHDAAGNVVALVKEDNHVMAAIRRLVTTLLPFSYSITSPDGSETYGTISEQFSFRDKYHISLADGALDPRLVVVGSVVIDAIEDN
ncbi:hypothetical protein AUR64_13930 [Haloprofundus marisrubri]|uniref:Uncharacterized protein n=1 Tax=Haloprofundus marisrubri TaxID=1514971 RepID=A0A0W1R7X4_9EURY|nr:hypothetical protein [Haloprofundus marisrubri]KTG09547.1 hypothetical protein AUR64_13930 [Haloprofundus marisrubri]